MRILTQRWFAVAVALAVAFGLASSLAVAQAQGRTGAATNSVTIGMTQEPDSLNPLFRQTAAAGQVIFGFTHLNLFMNNPAGGFDPVLLERTPTVENGDIVILPDGRQQIDYRLRRGLRWSDGVEITAEDYVFTYQLMMDPNLPIPSRTLQSNMASVEAVDSHTIRIVYENPEPFPTHWWHFIVPKHYYEPIYEEYKATGAIDYGQRFAKDERIAVKPVGNGPFVVDEWVSGDYIRLRRNPYYNVTDGPHLDSVVFRIIPDSNTLRTNLLTGAVDMVAEVGLSLDMVLSLQQRNELPNHEIEFIPTFSFYHLQMVLEEPPFNDRRVRQAALHAIDREAISQALFAGRQPVAHTWYPPGHYAFTEDVRKYDYNPDEARRLLREAGYTPDAAGMLRDAQGNPLRVKLITVAGDRIYEQMQQIILAYWRDVGIDATGDSQPAPVFFGETFMKVDEPGTVLLWSWTLDYENLGKQWRSDEIPRAENNYAGQNFARWSHPRNDELLDRARVTLDEAERAAILREQQLLWTEELPDLPLLYRVKTLIRPKNLRGVEMGEFGFLGTRSAGWKWE